VKGNKMTKEVTQARIQNEIAMYGERPEIFWSRHKAFVQMTGIEMFVSGLMSDAQECIAHGMDEEARQILNKAKWVLFAKLEGAI
jgi:hypothetical protein